MKMKVSKIKQKVAAKITKGKAKIAKKCGRRGKTVAALLVAFAVTAVVGGCLRPAAPSRSQHLAFDDCTFVIIGGGDGGSNSGCTNDVARIEIGSQAMQVETSGTENNTNTPTQTVDTKPDIDVSIPVNKANAGTSGASMGALENVVGAAGDWAADKIRGSNDKGSSSASATPPADTASSAVPSGGECTNGACTPK